MAARMLLLVHLALGVVGCVPPTDQAPATPHADPVVTAPAEPPAPTEEPPPTDAQAPESASVEFRQVEPGITNTNAPTRGTLPPAVVEEKLNSAGPGITACYERSLKTKPDLAGNLSIDFVVAPDGKVAHAEAGAVEQPLNDAATVECILGEIRKLEFPEPKGGRVFLNYPMRLEPPRPGQ